MNYINKDTTIQKVDLDAQMVDTKIGIIKESIGFWERKIAMHSSDENFVRLAQKKLKEEYRNLDDMKNKHPEFFI